MAEIGSPRWGLCLVCGHPLRSWFSQLDGAGLSCLERVGRHEVSRLVRAQLDLEAALELLDLQPRTRCWRSRIAIYRITGRMF
jgi:hypothetical protein